MCLDKIDVKTKKGRGYGYKTGGIVGDCFTTSDWH